jgi:hypothetical protein
VNGEIRMRRCYPMKKKLLSFRIEEYEINWIKEQSKMHGVNKSKFIRLFIDLVIYQSKKDPNLIEKARREGGNWRNR